MTSPSSIGSLEEGGPTMSALTTVTSAVTSAEADLGGFHRARRGLRAELDRLARAAAGRPAVSYHEQELDHVLRITVRMLRRQQQWEGAWLWPRLYAAVPEAVFIFDACEADHAAVSLLIDRLGHTCGTRRAPVLRELCALLDEHYDREDREVLPLIRAHVPAAEWSEASRQVVEDYDRAVWSLYCWPCLF